MRLESPSQVRLRRTATHLRSAQIAPAITAQLPLRILALSDLHAEESLLERIPACATGRKPDAILILGDITNRGPVSYADDLIEALKSTGIPAHAIFGNIDPPEVQALLEEKGVSVHARRVKLNGWNLAGFGGSGPTPYGTPAEFPEEEIYAGLAGLKINSKTVLMTHSPPFDASGLDKSWKGELAGSRSIRRIIEERTPALNLCGHIHEREGEARIGSTAIVKVGPANKGHAAIVEMGSKINVEFIKL